MLSQLLIVRLKAAENALRDGRLDEAYRLATAPDLRDHRRAGAVVAALTERFIERARAHFRADRFAEALIDLDRAEAGGVMKEELSELRAHVRTVQAEQQRKEQSRRERLDAAKRRIEGGSLAAGRRVLEQASEHDLAARNLRQQVNDRVDEVRAGLELAETLMAQGQWTAAADRVRRLKSIDAHDKKVARIETTLCKKVLDNARGALLEGRIGRAEDELACLGKLGDTLPSKREIRDMLSLARQAARGIQAYAYADARRDVMSLHRRLPKAGWVKEAIEQLRYLEDIRTELGAGPLGEISGLTTADAGGTSDPVAAQPASLDDTVALPHRVHVDAGLPERLLLLVDGGGSFLILRGPQASIGRAATCNPPDVPIFSDLAERHANVARVDDDYFLFSAKDVEVAGRPTKHQLLRDGQRIVLGRKAKLTYRLPSRKSPTAALDLSDTTKMPNDVRRVVLFSRQATLGQGPTAHIQCRHASVPLILFDRGGSLWIRPKNDGHVDAEARPLKLGEPIEMAGASLVLEPWTARTPGSTL
jgi:hypothetical protein